MGLSQIQIIRSLGETLEWFEKELEWGVNPAELRHLTGRIGELYVAMRTRGQMALEVNQRGYDVVSAEGEQISVKTITSTKHIRFNLNSFEYVHRVVIIRIAFDENNEISIEEILDKPADDFLAYCRVSQNRNKYIYSLCKETRSIPLSQQKVAKKASYDSYQICEYENGKIVVTKDGEKVVNTNQILQKIALSLGVDIFTRGGNQRSNRRLGVKVIAAIELNNVLS